MCHVIYFEVESLLNHRAVLERKEGKPFIVSFFAFYFGMEQPYPVIPFGTLYRCRSCGNGQKCHGCGMRPQVRLYHLLFGGLAQRTILDTKVEK